MMVGAGSCQINGIKALKKMGHTVVVADYNETSLGKRLADLSVIADAFNCDAILQAAKAYAVDAIMTVGTDQPLLPVAKAAEALGLRSFVSSKTAYEVTNKRAMKLKFIEQGIDTVPFAIISKGFPASALSHIRPPYVVKPLDSQGQRGIFLLDTIEAIREHVDKVLVHSRETSFLVESYYKNEEITVSGWVLNGAVSIFTITDRVTFSPKEHIGVCVSHEYPSKHIPHFQAEIIALTHKICHAFEIQNGPIYFQMLVGDEGVKVNEIACRLGGAFEDVTIPYVTGVEVLALNIEGCLPVDRSEDGPEASRLVADALARVNSDGKDVSYEQRRFSTQLFFCHPGEVVTQTPLETLLAQPFILEAGYNFYVGDTLKPIESASQRAGYMIVTGESEEALMANVDRAYELLKWEDHSGKNLVLKRKREKR
jgi:phosphoribosylaminoimidazole carboxylase (NCAIR synthetase)